MSVGAREMKGAGKSPFVTSDAAHHAEELGRLHPGEVHEFYHPFVMVPDVVELVRVINPDYGPMDMVVLLEPKPVEVYVNGDAGERFLKERFPQVRARRVAHADLRLNEVDGGTGMLAELRAKEGRLRGLSLTIRADLDARIEVERYESHNVWGSDFSCHGIDLRQAATCRGTIQWERGAPEALDTPATIFRGSYGKLVPNAAPKPRGVRRQRTR